MSTNDTSSLDSDVLVSRIQEYVRAREKWKQECRDPIGPQTVEYETFAGRAGDAARRHAHRISSGFATVEEETALAEKKQGDEAFRSQNYKAANEHYQNALRREKWTEAEDAAKCALREYIMVYGHSYGPFHIKVYHRLGLSSMGKGCPVQAECYYQQALNVNPNNTSVRDELMKAHNDAQLLESRLKNSSDDFIRERAAIYGKYWDAPPEYWDVLSRAGATPWDEDAKGLILVAQGVPLVERAYHPSEDDLTAFEEHLRDKGGRLQCQHCGGFSRGSLAVMRVCQGCGEHMYCSELCQVQNWSVHKIMCVSNQQVSKAEEFQKREVYVLRRMQKIMDQKSPQLASGGICSLELHYDPKAFEKYAVVVDFEYQPDPGLPLRALDIRKVLWEELKQKYPDTITNIYESWRKSNANSANLGIVGQAVLLGLVVDGTWNAA